MKPISIDDAPAMFANLSKAFEQNMPKVLMNMANLGAAEVQARVFNRGQSADGVTMHYKAAKRKTTTAYGPNIASPYQRKRLDFGRQVAHKDLIFTGDMFNALNIRVRAPLVVDYAFTNDGAALIAGYQEESAQVGKPIFKLNTNEIAIVEKAGIKDVARISQAVIDAFPNMPTMKADAMKRTTKRTVRPATAAKRKQKITRAKNAKQRKTKRKF